MKQTGTQKIEIKEFDGSNRTIWPLAKSYMRSYNTLSQAYKAPEEMKLYDYNYFVGKLLKFAEDKESSVFVVNVDDKPKGFVRYSPILAYYKSPDEEGIAKEVEKGEMDGRFFTWQRKVHFSSEQRLDDRTLIVNQIYIDPEEQAHGLGTKLLRETLPKMRDKGFGSLIIEYNRQNFRAKKFYGHLLGLEKIAETKDLDHIIGNTHDQFCISDVEMGFSTIEASLRNINKIIDSKVQPADMALLKPVPKSL